MIHLPEITLASTSPQRIQILQELGISFTVAKKDTDEIIAATPEKTVKTNSMLKVLDVSEGLPVDAIIVGADTVLSKAGRIFGKPENEDAARKTLQGFSRQKVQAFTGLAVVRADRNTGWVAVETAEIEFDEISKETIDWYVGTGEPLSRAGSICINRIGEVFVKNISGSYSCIAGLPKCSLLTILYRLGAGSQPSAEMVSFYQMTNADITPFCAALLDCRDLI